MKLKTAGLMAGFLLGLALTVCRAQDFTADVVYLGSGTSARQSATLYVSNDKVRLETHGLDQTVLLVNGGEHTSFALFPARKAYQPLAAGPSQYFRAQNADDACPEWQRAAAQKIVCEKVGHDDLDGRQTVKYRNKGASDDETSAVWIDTALNFVIKWEGGGTGAQLRNIKEGKHEAALFAVPSDYKPLKPQKGTSRGFAQRSQ